MKPSNRKLAVTVTLCTILLAVASPQVGAKSQLMLEMTAGEGMSFTAYRSDSLDLEPHEFPEFNHEIGISAFLYKTFDWFGIGLGAGGIYNLYGASSEYLDNPTLKYMFHWIKFPLLASFAVIRNSSAMHFDVGMYGSLFLGGEKIWRDTGAGIDETVRLTRNSISDDYGIRAQAFIDMGLISLEGIGAELALGLGLMAEKSLADISEEPSVEMNSFRLGASLAFSLLFAP